MCKENYRLLSEANQAGPPPTFWLGEVLARAKQAADRGPQAMKRGSVRHVARQAVETQGIGE